MIKELKYLFFILFIFFFIFFSAKYYFSDDNEKKTYRSFINLDIEIKKKEKNLFLLKNNTENIIDYVENNKDKNTKKYSFWELLYNE